MESDATAKRHSYFERALELISARRVVRSPLPATARTIDENDACFIIRDVRRCPLNVSRCCHQSCVFCHLSEHHSFFSTLHLDYNERRPPANHALPLNPHVLRNPSV
jgi:2-iminoacetate synthase ThiH